jgi:Na+-transporting methylmalonyl-CoA/oxaloacetate decarboxylase gamma subunit
MLDALWIVLLGMAIIFAVLGILLGMMLLLNKLIKPGEEE